MAYKVIILYQLYMPSYFLGTFTEYPYGKCNYRIVFHDVHMVGMPIGTDIEGFEWVWNN